MTRRLIVAAVVLGIGLIVAAVVLGIGLVSSLCVVALGWKLDRRP